MHRKPPHPAVVALTAAACALLAATAVAAGIWLR